MSIPLPTTISRGAIYLQFTAYPGYSSGSFSLDYVFSPCNTSVLFGCQRPLVYHCPTDVWLPCSPFIDTWRRSTHVPSCVDIWTVNSHHFQCDGIRTQLCYRPIDHENHQVHRPKKREICYNHHSYTELQQANIIGPYDASMAMIKLHEQVAAVTTFWRPCKIYL